LKPHVSVTIAAAGILLFSLPGWAQPAEHAKAGRAASELLHLSSDDYVEIQQLYSAFALALDTGNGDAQLKTFSADGKFASSVTNHKFESAIALSKRTTSEGITGARHFMTNIAIAPTPTGAKGTCYAIVLTGHRNADGGMSGMPAFYEDALVKTTDGWRFKAREFWLGSEAASSESPAGH